MGFKDVKEKVIASLLADDYSHEARQDIDEKNLLSVGKITAAEYLHACLMVWVFPALASTFLSGLMMYGLIGAVPLARRFIICWISAPVRGSSCWAG